MKRTMILLLTVVLQFCMAVNAAALKYAPPYAAVDGGRAAQNMPTVFSIDTAPKVEAASADFNSEDGGVNGLTITTPEVDWWSLEDGAVKIMKTGTDAAKSVVLKYAPEGGLRANDTYAFSCRIKTEAVEGGAPRNILTAYGGGKWLNETHGYDGKNDVTGTNDWYEMKQMLIIPENTAYLNLSAYLKSEMTGTVYFDDFKLYRIAYDPLESVLCAPNYKGLLYGDGLGDIDLDIRITEQPDFHHLEDMELTVRLLDGEDNVLRSAEAKTLSSRMNFVFSSQGLAEGDYYLQSVLSEKESGEVVSQKEHTIRKRAADYRPAAYLDENGHYVKNGQKTFLKRIYNYSGGYQEVAEAAKEAGVDTISHYGMWWAVETPDTTALQLMRDNGITSHICLGSYWFSDLSGNMGTSLIQEQTDILPLLTQIANDYKGDEILEGYYVFDEPDPIFEGEEIRWNNEILAQADLDHPTFGVADKGYDYYGVYNKMTDILGIDPYPITGKVDENNVSVDDIAEVGRSMREIKQNFPNRPVYLVLQGFHYAGRGDLRSPTYEELRNMAWQAICEGAEGLDWYAYPDMKTDENKEFDQWWSEFRTLYSEVDSYKEVILSDEPAPLYTVSGGGDWLNLSVKRHNGKTYIFAVNNTHTAQSATLNINGMEEGVDLSFAPLGVVLQEHEQAEFLSPEAELESMGFYNGDEAFSVAEGEENILYVPEDAGVINYTAHISDGARLYIGGIERPESGKITVRVAEQFTVRVVAADGVTESRKTYRVVKYE